MEAEAQNDVDVVALRSVLTDSAGLQRKVRRTVVQEHDAEEEEQKDDPAWSTAGTRSST